ncbi:MAG: protein arginine kinase [Planctomycetaceae bacterium]|nr:protein arginine kinase [Planctomycetaceae bacterium]
MSATHEFERIFRISRKACVYRRNISLSSDDSSNGFCLTELSRTSGEWLRGDGPESDIVISCRVRLARNIAGFPFINRMSPDARNQVVELVRGIAKTSPDGQPMRFLNVETMSTLDCQLLMERQLISRELSRGDGARGVIISPGERHSIMINEEDHLRIQVLQSGLALEECWQECDALDDQIEAGLSYAFHEQFGYLTACPTNVGTGIRVSVMLHLPALRLTREIQKVNQAAQKINLAVRGLYGEGSQAMGDFYQISNQITLGRSENELMDNVMEVVNHIISWERRVRDLLLKDNRGSLHDQVARAFGVLTSARSISSEETMHLLSSIRMGLRLGLIDNLDMATVNELFVHTQPAHLQKLHGETLESNERNLARATCLRRRLIDSSLGS